MAGEVYYNSFSCAGEHQYYWYS